ncbi:hypothetical protein D3C72_1642300 [compost metagenome]
MGMATTRSSAGITPMPPAPGRLHNAEKPCALAIWVNCQVSHSSDSTTSGSATREMSRRTRCTMEPSIRAISRPPHSRVAAQGQYSACMLPAWRPMATVESRITTSSKAPQPSS